MPEPYKKQPDGSVAFQAKLEKAADSEACGIDLPFDPKDVFGKTRLPVTITLNGAPFRTTTFLMNGRIFFAVNLSMRETAGIRAGDLVHVTVRPDTEERTVDLPPDLGQLLAQPSHREEKVFFDSLSFTHRKEFVRWITGAKQEATRQRRLAKCLEMLKGNQKPHF